MSWPTDNISLSGLESATTYNSAVRSFLWSFVKIVKALIGARGVPNGVASLGSNGKVPDAQLGRATANGVCDLDSGGMVPGARIGKAQADGVASLDASGKVPNTQLPRGDANGVCELDATGNVPIGRIPKGEPDTVAQLNSGGKVPATQLPSASNSAAGIVRTANAGEVKRGVGDRVVTPSNLVSSPHVAKMWALIENGTLVEQHGVTSVSRSGNKVRINFPSRTNTKYAVLATPITSNIFLVVKNTTQNYCEIEGIGIGHDGANHSTYPSNLSVCIFDST